MDARRDPFVRRHNVGPTGRMVAQIFDRRRRAHEFFLILRGNAADFSYGVQERSIAVFRRIKGALWHGESLFAPE